MRKNKILKIVFRIVISVLTLVLLFSLPNIDANISEDFSYISSIFVGSKSKYQGVIEVWNIDSFESGCAPKVNYLNKIASLFQKQNRGLYVVVRNLTEFECMNLLSSGVTPDIFSCSYGVASEIKDFVQPFSNASDIDILENLLNSGKYNECLYALPWCMGAYCLISTDSHLSKSKLDLDGEIDLSNLALSLGYEIKNKNSTKIVSSLTFGTQKYLLPKQAFNSYNNKGLILTSAFSLDENVKSQTPYTAYSKFLAGSSVVLLGSQRDIYRMENRLSLGKVSKVFYEPLTTFTDLIQFTLLAKSDNNLRLESSENFCKKLVESASQKYLKNIGMFPVTGQCDVYDKGIMLDITLDIIGVSGLNNIFIQKSEIINLQ